MRYLSYVLLGLVFSSAVSSAELIPGKDIRLLLLNEEETESMIEPVELKAGFTQIAVRVTTKTGKGSNKSVFDSAPFLMTFEANGNDIKIVAPNINDYELANRHFKGVPDMKLVGQNGEVDYTYQKIEGKGGFMPYQDLQELVKAHNEKSSIFFGTEAEITAKAQLAETSIDSEVVNVEKTTGLHHSNNLDQLKAWYLKASKADRKEFRKWMIDQE